MNKYECMADIAILNKVNKTNTTKSKYGLCQVKLSIHP